MLQLPLPLLSPLPSPPELPELSDPRPLLLLPVRLEPPFEEGVFDPCDEPDEDEADVEFELVDGDA